MSYVDPYSGGTSGGNDPQQGYGAGPSYGTGPAWGPGQDPSAAYGGYGAPGYGQPRRRKGLKRIIVGSIGIVLNTIGLFVMPFVAAVVGALIAIGSASDPVALSPTGGTVPVDSMSMVTIAVPAGEAQSVTCTAHGGDLDPVSSPMDVGSLGGVPYESAYQLSSPTTTEVVVECTGASGVAYTETGMVGMLVAMGIGVVIPIVLGVASLVLLIWGIIARVRS